ncbi:hypothetical protein FOL47_002857 [Perkinsus chesapeaki]|uniref:S1/P1 Nuclease n=1 Tax=Perkinsus chesapeaki TaxID=330153 RepID=A0A7J6MB90_PERCH|nr:hypothetical protein FOL47_002857 [Perkinsus chesapeaki]
MKLRLLSLAATLLPAIFAWGGDGHAVIAQLSQDRIHGRTRGAIDGIMGRGVPMTSYASWADQIMSNIAWRWSSRLHFVTTPDCRYIHARDCYRDFCFVGALKNYSRQVADARLPLRQRQEALKFIVHFVGDAHQPMHAGKPNDRGGNTIGVRLGFATRQPTNLHSTWDSSLLYELQRRGPPLPGQPHWKVTERAVSKVLHERYANHVRLWTQDCEKYGLDTCIVKWADETVRAACDYGYKHVDGSAVKNNDVLPIGYYNNRIEVAKEQLAKSVVRLTWLLDHLFKR